MITIPQEFSKQISAFAPLFSKKVFEHAKVLVLGALLVVGRRTVCSALRVVGLSQERGFDKYHRVLSLAKWSAYQAARTLLLMLVQHFVPEGPIVFGLDETIERRWGRKIKARGIYRDAVRSSRGHFVKCSGLRWMCLMLLTPIKWANRIWALPFLTVLAPSKRYYKNLGKQHKKLTDWARQMILQLARWLPGRPIIVVGDRSYACIELLDAVRQQVCMITRLRLDAALYDFPPPRPKGKRGPKRKKGKRLPTLKQLLECPDTKWQSLIIPQWYGHGPVELEVASGTAIWYHSGKPPVPCRWVLIRDPAGLIKPAALLCTDRKLAPELIMNFFIRRWTVEVTFEEVRTHLGVESQRQWSDKAIARTTPVLMALFSLVTLWADQLQNHRLLCLQPCAWYKKSHPTFSDAIASVRKHIWRYQKFSTSGLGGNIHNLEVHWIEHLINMATRAA